MRKVIGAINMTLDGYCDHTAIIPDEALHQHYADLLKQAGIILYGRITYQLMEYWRSVVENPTGTRATDGFAIIMDKLPKLLFSNTIKTVDWKTAKLATLDLEEEVLALKQQHGDPICVGSRSLIMQLLQADLLDEFQLCIHPVIAGGGLPLFENLHDRTLLKLANTKTFASGAIVHYYERSVQNPDQS